MGPMNELWTFLDGPGSPPETDVDGIKARVNTALDTAPIKKKPSRLRFLLAAALLTAAIAGGALAVGGGWNVLTAMFRGDAAPWQSYLNDTPRSVSDDDYTFTVESSVSDGNNVYLLLTVTAHNEETLEYLMSPYFGCNMDFDAWVPDMEPRKNYFWDTIRPGVASITYAAGSVAQTETSRSWYLVVELNVENADRLRVRLNHMEEDRWVDIPLLESAPSVTVEINASGTAAPNTAEGTLSYLSIGTVTLSPFSCTMDAGLAPNSSPRIFFRMADGSVRTKAQMLTGSGHNSSDPSGTYRYLFREIQPLENITSIIVFDTEYPLDGSAPFPIEHDPSLDPVTVPRGGPLLELEEYYDELFPIQLKPLMEALGGTFEEGPEPGQFTCTYRDKTVVFDPQDQEVTLDGRTLSTASLLYLGEGPIPYFLQSIQEGEPVASFSLIKSTWGLNGSVIRSSSAPSPDISDLGDWYVIP